MACFLLQKYNLCNSPSGVNTLRQADTLWLSRPGSFLYPKGFSKLKEEIHGGRDTARYLRILAAIQINLAIRPALVRGPVCSIKQNAIAGGQNFPPGKRLKPFLLRCRGWLLLENRLVISVLHPKNFCDRRENSLYIFPCVIFPQRNTYSSFAEPVVQPYSL